MANLAPYRGLPQMAGLCTIEQAMSPGLAVEECVRRLKRYHYGLKRLHVITNARITAEPAGVTFTAIVGAQPPTAFVMRAGPDGEAVFENLAHDFPQRVIYRRCGADLCARVEGQVKGRTEAQEWRYTRIRP